MDAEATLRRRLDRYLEAAEPATAPGVLGVCLTGSLAAGYVDEHADIDLTVVVDGDADRLTSPDHGGGTRPRVDGDGTAPRVDGDALGEALVPDGADVQRWAPLEKYSFDWADGHVDVAVRALDALRAAEWDLPTRWEYDNAEVLVDPDGQLADRLAREVPFDPGERADLVATHADAFLFAAQWDVHKACLRGSYHAAHLAATGALDDAVALLFLREGRFPPRDKWLPRALEDLERVDDEGRDLVWEATRVRERTPGDLHRRVRALRRLWERLAPVLREQGCLDESLAWGPDPADLCCVE